MKKTIIFTALALGLIVTQAATYGPAHAFRREPVTCPVFTTAMVDAAGLAALLLNVEPPVQLRDYEEVPETLCQFVTFGGAGQFFVEVGGADGTRVQGLNRGIIGATVVVAVRDGLSQSELFACRAEVLRSLVWKQHCAPFLFLP